MVDRKLMSFRFADFPKLKDYWRFLDNNRFAENFFEAYHSSPESDVPKLELSTHLCRDCETMNDDLFKPNFSIIYATSAVLERTQSRECDLCPILYHVWKIHGPENDSTFKLRRIDSVLYMNDKEIPVLSIFREIGSSGIGEKIQIGFGKLPEASSPTFFKLIRAWMHECESDSEHYNCRLAKDGYYSNRDAPMQMPTRVIDVNTGDPDTVRLHETNEGEIGEWIALSHPWGNEKHFFTTTDNVEKHRMGMSYATLPPTFKDAVTVTRELGHRYLWIDSLCIIQGEGGDFGKESSRMEDVYSGAYCVIAASRSRGHYSGFLQKRHERPVVALRSKTEQPIYICALIDDFKAHVLDGELNRRAWVMQEHALARRTIFFTDYQSYWECGQGIKCESMASMSNDLAASLGDPNFPRILIGAQQGERILRYQKLFQDYSRLGLTNPHDRPVAIEGLQRRLLRVLNARGKFGILDQKKSKGLLCRSLLWRRGADMGSTSLVPINFPAVGPTTTVPSWSWMAYTGGIDYLQPTFGGYSWENLEPLWSQVQEGSNGLTLFAHAKEFVYDSQNQSAVDGELFMDDTETKDGDKQLCVVVGVEKKDIPEAERRHYVILVKVHAATPQDQLVYRRVGVGHLLGRCILGGGHKVTIG